MSEDTFAWVLAMLAVLVMATLVWMLSGKLDKYEDTIAEYTMCIEYNPDCECSDIILSEYGEEK